MNEKELTQCEHFLYGLIEIFALHKGFYLSYFKHLVKSGFFKDYTLKEALNYLYYIVDNCYIQKDCYNIEHVKQRIKEAREAGAILYEHRKMFLIDKEPLKII